MKNNVRIYKGQDIQEEFTETVKGFINAGWVINTASMNGSQGEIAKVDFTDYKNIVRVWMDSHCNFTDGWRDEVRIHVEMFDYKPSTGLFADIWNGKGNELATSVFCQLDQNNRCGSLGGAFVEPRDWDKLGINEKRVQRSNVRRENKVVKNMDKWELLKIVRRQNGLKTATVDDIAEVYKAYDYKNDKFVGYKIKLRNRRYSEVEVLIHGTRAC